jgi:hypothetical protein
MKIINIGLIGLVLYFFIACIVFAFRHPWMTEMERALNIGKAIKFEKVSYEQTRNKYK